MYRLEIEEKIALRCEVHEVKRFKKRARAFRKENDPMAAANPFVEFLHKEFEPDFAGWILLHFVRSLKNAEKREALCAAGGLSVASIDTDDMEENKLQRQNSCMSMQEEEADRRSKTYGTLACAGLV